MALGIMQKCTGTSWLLLAVNGPSQMSIISQHSGCIDQGVAAQVSGEVAGLAQSFTPGNIIYRHVALHILCVARLIIGL